ncbi:hypothetical protein IW262DRAFT_1292320 [Armillaria fumosa]|nr:hypothetical protein IW262DRAFT_1292320 [Armillaria fumosa]
MDTTAGFPLEHVEGVKDDSREQEEGQEAAKKVKRSWERFRGEVHDAESEVDQPCFICRMIARLTRNSVLRCPLFGEKKHQDPSEPLPPVMSPVVDEKRSDMTPSIGRLRYSLAIIILFSPFSSIHAIVASSQ